MKYKITVTKESKKTKYMVEYRYKWLLGWVIMREIDNEKPILFKTKKEAKKFINELINPKVFED